MRKPSADRGRAGAHVLRPCPAASPLRRSPRRRRRRSRGARRRARAIRTSARRAPACLRAFASPSWTIRNTSICSSGREPDAVVDLELDLERAVGGEEVDVAAQRRVERGRAAGRREREHGEARLLLGGRRRLLQLRQRLLRGRRRPRACSRASRPRTGTAPGRRGSRARRAPAPPRPRGRTRRSGSRARRRRAGRRTRAGAGSRPARRSRLESSGVKT